MNRTYVIADLHGRYDLLIAALNEIVRRDKGGTIITLGDYIDRGPDSRFVIQHLTSLRRKPRDGWHVICLKGNHEQMMVDTLRTPLNSNWWLGNGGDATLSSYNGHVSENDLSWIAALPSLYFDRHRVYVHAGVDPMTPLEEQQDDILLWKRYPNDEDIGHGKRHVVHGHTPRPHGPERLTNRTNLDTYAWRAGRLVVGVFDDALPGGPTDLIQIRGSAA